MVGELEGLDAVTLDRGKVHTVPPCDESACISAYGKPGITFGGVLHWMVMSVPDKKTPPTCSAPNILSFVPKSAFLPITGWSGTTGSPARPSRGWR